MYSVVDLVNMALRQIKVREIISLDDETVEAKSAKQMLKLSLGDLLNRADWRFAKVKRVLPKLWTLKVLMQLTPQRRSCHLMFICIRKML